MKEYKFQKGDAVQVKPGLPDAGMVGHITGRERSGMLLMEYEDAHGESHTIFMFDEFLNLVAGGIDPVRMSSIALSPTALADKIEQASQGGDFTLSKDLNLITGVSGTLVDEICGGDQEGSPSFFVVLLAVFGVLVAFSALVGLVRWFFICCW